MTTPTPFAVGYSTELQLRSVPEMAISGYVNANGIPDTTIDCNTRANAVYAGFIREFLVQINNIANGTLVVPGIANVAGKSWRPGDDGANTVDAVDCGAYGITLPTNLWLLNGTLGASLGSQSMLTNYADDGVYELVNARGGVNGEPRFVHAARSLYGLHRYSSANITGIGATMTLAFFVTLSGWNQTHDGVVLMSHRDYQSATETGSTSRLGFELGLGYASGNQRRQELSLYYRHINASEAEVLRVPITAGPGRVAFPFGREVFVAIQRTSTALTVYLNGLLYSTFSFSAGNGPSPGNGAVMRLVMGSDWDGSRYLNGSLRNVAMWTGTQPTAAMLLNYYRVGSGFSPKAVGS